MYWFVVHGSQFGRVNWHYSLDFDSIKDGLSNTLFLGEKDLRPEFFGYGMDPSNNVWGIWPTAGMGT